MRKNPRTHSTFEKSARRIYIEEDGEQAGTAGYWRWTGGNHHCLLPPQVFVTDFIEFTS
jgi:hypothetical protein